MWQAVQGSMSMLFSLVNSQLKLVVCVGKMTDDPFKILDDLIACSICSNFIGTRIFQCPRGHHFCRECAIRMNICPSCRSAMPRAGIRNLCLEKILDSLDTIPCPEHTCPVKLDYKSMETHYRTCSNRIISCPIYGCKWIGKPIDCCDHARNDHFDIIIPLDTEGLTVVRVNNPLEGSIDMCSQILISTDEYLILISLWIIKDQPHATHSVTITPMYIGSPTDAENYVVTISVNLNSGKIKQSHSQPPWNLLDSVSVVSRDPSNMYIPWISAVSATGAVYRETDQLRAFPQPKGLDLSLAVSVSYKSIIELRPEKSVVVPFKEIFPDDV